MPGTNLVQMMCDNKKLTYAALSAVVFMGVSLPQTYSVTDRYIGSYTGSTLSGTCPSPVGKFLHTGVFFVVLYVLMKLLNRTNMSDGLIAKYSFYSTLLFFLVTSSDTYALTSQVPALKDIGIVDATGCPTKQGVVVHGLVFMVLLVLVMYFPRD